MAVATVGLVVIAWRGLRAGPAIDQAMEEGLGAGWRHAIDAAIARQSESVLVLAAQHVLDRTRTW